MIKQLRAWLRRWLGINSDQRELLDEVRDAEKRFMEIIKGRDAEQRNLTDLFQLQIESMKAEIARLQLAAYVPPVTPAPEVPKKVKARTMKEFDMIREQELEKEFTSENS